MVLVLALLLSALTESFWFTLLRLPGHLQSDYRDGVSSDARKLLAGKLFAKLGQQESCERNVFFVHRWRVRDSHWATFYSYRRTPIADHLSQRHAGELLPRRARTVLKGSVGGPWAENPLPYCPDT